jgi:hypothetical protein
VRSVANQHFVNSEELSLTYATRGPKFRYMEDFDQLLTEYRHAIDAWVAAIKAEEALANEDHSMIEMEKWDAAGLHVHDTELAAKKARDRYKNALRKKNYGF